MWFLGLSDVKCRIVEIPHNIHRSLIFLMVAAIMILVLVVNLSTSKFAESQPEEIKDLHNSTLYEVVKQPSGVDENAQINIGGRPLAMDFDEGTNTMYILNNSPRASNGSVSVISTINNTKIGDIPVGENPNDIAVNELLDTVHVSNADSNSVSVISTINNTKIGDIPVGENPNDISADTSRGILSVANFGSNTISVFFPQNNTWAIESIPVGDGPTDIDSVEDFSSDCPTETYTMQCTDYLYITLFVANFGSNSVSVISMWNTLEAWDSGMLPHIEALGNMTVGDGPRNIVVNERSSAVYVANVGYNGSISTSNGSVSAIFPYNNTVRNIAGGKNSPNDIVIDESTNTVYVENFDTVSVISNNTWIKDIPIGYHYLGLDLLTNIAINERTNTVYVANAGNNSISAIFPQNNTWAIESIPVGDGPTYIAINERTNTVYVANARSNSISIIDGEVNKPVAGVTFQINPFNSGYIVCYDPTTNYPYDLTPPSPTGEYIYVYSGNDCIAKPNEGFEFVSWEENLKGNSTQLISVSRPPSPLDSLADFMDPDPIEESFDSILKSLGVQSISQYLGLHRDEPEAATLNITKFGTFTANFKELPPPVPEEFWLQSYALVGSVIAGLSIPSIVGWIRSKRDVRKLKYYHRQIASLYGDGKLDENDIEALDRLRSRIGDAYSEGKLNEKHYESLRNEISTLYEEIFRKKIAALDSNNNSVVKKPVQDQLVQIRNEVELAFSRGKINEKHYNLLTKTISKLDGKHG